MNNIPPFAVVVAFAAVFGVASAAASAPSSGAVRWTCSVPILPEYKAKDTGPDVGEAATYLYVGDKHLQSDYGAEAVFTAPPDLRRGWYDSGVRLGPLNENNGSVQLEISRWQRFDYRAHLALAWAVPHGDTVEYRDLGVMLSDGPHRIGVYVRDGLLRLVADGRTVCTTRASYFVTPAEPKYFQIRTETATLNTNGNARVADLRLKTDFDADVRSYTTDCDMHRHGIFWASLGNGSFVARGAFYPGEPTFFTGLDPSTPCRV